MPHLDFGSLNYFAVGAAAGAVFILGSLWYGVLLRTAWARQHGYSDEQLKAMQARMPMPVFFAGMIVCYFVAALALAVMLPPLGAVSLVGGTTIGLVVWAIVAAFRLTGHLASPKPIGAYLIDAVFDLIALGAMGAILGSWR